MASNDVNLQLQDLENSRDGSPYSDDEEGDSFLPKDEIKQVENNNHDQKQASLWIAVNVVATVLIVFTNKSIFDDKNLRFVQISFAAFHFTVTWLGLWILSLDRFAFFKPKQVSFTQMIPLSIAMTLNVIFPNLSLAYSTVAFYQIARVLVTPCVAILDYILYRVSMSYLAISTLVLACLGVTMVSYYDSRDSDDVRVKTTSSIGILFALTGVFFSSLYTVWIAAFRKKLAVSSMQLLLNQAPISAFLLLYFIPWIDTFPIISQVSVGCWVLIPFASYPFATGRPILTLRNSLEFWPC
ncbi:hypothetical protein ACHAPJ_011173 [Fusarium lateritium]